MLLPYGKMLSQLQKKKTTTPIKIGTVHSRGGSGVKFLLHKARKQPKYDEDSENVLMSELEKIDQNKLLT